MGDKKIKNVGALDRVLQPKVKPKKDKPKVVANPKPKPTGKNLRAAIKNDARYAVQDVKKVLRQFKKAAGFASGGSVNPSFGTDFDDR